MKVSEYQLVGNYIKATTKVHVVDPYNVRTHTKTAN